MRPMSQKYSKLRKREAELAAELAEVRGEIRAISKESALCVRIIVSQRTTLSEKSAAMKRLEELHPDRAYDLWSCKDVGAKLLTKLALEGLKQLI